MLSYADRESISRAIIAAIRCHSGGGTGGDLRFAIRRSFDLAADKRRRHRGGKTVQAIRERHALEAPTQVLDPTIPTEDGREHPMRGGLESPGGTL